MKGKQKSKRGMYWIFFVLDIFLLIGIGYVFNSNRYLLKVIPQEPTNIEVVNISTTDAWVYWKAPQDGLHTLLFKKFSDAGEFKEVENIGISKDIVDEKRVFYTNIQNLQPDTLYVFQIKTEDGVWDVSNPFKTKPISQEVKLPEVVTGDGDVMSLLLVDMGDEKLMVDTQYHGTYAFDSKGKEYKTTRYSTYISQDELKEKLAFILTSPVYASTGANCKVNIEVDTSGFVPSKSKVIDVIDRWVGSCPLGGYPETCYEDVYCKGLSLGVDPAFLFAIWAHESGGSNYAHLPTVEDFGVHGLSSVPVANFTKQIEHFISVQAQPSYIEGEANCEWKGPNPTTLSKEIIMWGARYWKGQCNTEQYLADGKQYMDGINQVYGWFTNKTLQWPFTRTKNSSTCSYTTAQTNTAYNSCVQKGPDTPPDDPTTGDGVKKWLPVTGIGNDGKPISPEIDKLCEDEDGCICIWKYNIKPGESTKNAKYNQVCTVAGQVINNPVPLPSPKCGTRATSYPASTTEWPAGSTLCEIGNPQPSTVVFPQVGKSIEWSCVNGTKSQTCRASVSDLPPVCCLEGQSVSWINQTQCSGEILEGVSRSNCYLKDVNIEIKRNVSFYQPMRVVNSNEVPIDTAKKLIEYSKGKILVVGEFLNNEWIKLVKYNNGNISGQDFNLEYGRVYLVISTEEFSIPIKSISIPFEKTDLTKLLGWNLIPSKYFDGLAKYTTEILTGDDFEYISQVAVWDDELGTFNYTIEDLTVEEGIEEMFGTYYDITTQQGIFVRISK